MKISDIGHCWYEQWMQCCKAFWHNNNHSGLIFTSRKRFWHTTVNLNLRTLPVFTDWFRRVFRLRPLARNSATCGVVFHFSPNQINALSEYAIFKLHSEQKIVYKKYFFLWNDSPCLLTVFTNRSIFQIHFDIYLWVYFLFADIILLVPCNWNILSLVFATGFSDFSGSQTQGAFLRQFRRKVLKQ